MAVQFVLEIPQDASRGARGRPIAAQVASSDPIAVFEPATPETCYESGYLLANPDIQALVQSGGDAGAHLQQFGHAEGRSQVSRSSHGTRLGDAGLERFRRLAPVIDARTATYLEGADRFPIVMSERHYSRADYVAESANVTFPLSSTRSPPTPTSITSTLAAGCWSEMLDGVPDEVLSEFACGNVLIAKKSPRTPGLWDRLLRRLHRV